MDQKNFICIRPIQHPLTDMWVLKYDFSNEAKTSLEETLTNPLLK